MLAICVNQGINRQSKPLNYQWFVLSMARTINGLYYQSRTLKVRTVKACTVQEALQHPTKR